MLTLREFGIIEYKSKRFVHVSIISVIYTSSAATLGIFNRDTRYEIDLKR